MVPSWPRCRCNTHTWLQVINTLLAFHTAGMPPATFTAKCKVSEREWGPDAVGSECVVHVRGGYLCHGTMDKAQYGGRGLLHATQVRYLLARWLLVCCHLQLRLPCNDGQGAVRRPGAAPRDAGALSFAQ